MYFRENEIKEEILLYLSESDNEEVSAHTVSDAGETVLRKKIIAKLSLT